MLNKVVVGLAIGLYTLTISALVVVVDNAKEKVRIDKINEKLWVYANQSASQLANCWYFKKTYPSYWRGFMKRMKRPFNITYEDDVQDVCAETITYPGSDDVGAIYVNANFFDPNVCGATELSMMGHELLHLAHMPVAKDHNVPNITHDNDPVYVTIHQCFKGEYWRTETK